MKAKLQIFFFLAVIGILSCSEKEPDRIVSFEDYDLHIKETGNGQPTVIIEAGLGCGLEYYDTLQTAVSEITRVLTYDRPGLGKSGKSPKPRTLPNYIDELKQLLEHEKIKPPYILVGHSLGGLLIRYFTHIYPDDIVGIVFIDCPHEDWLEYARSTRSAEDLEKFNSFIDPDLNGSKGVIKEEWEQFGQNCKILRGIELKPVYIPARDSFVNLSSSSAIYCFFSVTNTRLSLSPIQ